MKKNNAGFTLIELLASVTILMVIVWLMALIFTESDRAWNVGTGRAANNTEGRAGLQMLVHDLQYAVSDSLLTFHMGPDRENIDPYGFVCDELSCVSIQNDSSDSNRAVREVHYYVKEMTNSVGRYQLQRAFFSDDIMSNPNMHCYRNRNWWRDAPLGAGRPSASQVIAENVAGLAFYCPDPQNPNQRIRVYDTDNSSYSNRLPPYVDVLLEVLNDREAQQVEQMRQTGLPDATIQAFVEKNARRYTARTYFANRHGYKKR